ncbi:hypothetical protein [Parendozoicomonas haliclonae]|uniref:Uncharacterized protein n=1 Tax=Parendozoicomonas haliclonae TaxID=1960125 RepID=A0A1X7ARY1_9GAMM|nr:hypothetical protein [Parendozoicomonas haliclonae]SMA50858.1 hypothetical protein EHSB41UT_04676 [Parendozoicomonas haliclonae]
MDNQHDQMLDQLLSQHKKDRFRKGFSDRVMNRLSQDEAALHRFNRELQQAFYKVSLPCAAMALLMICINVTSYSPSVWLYGGVVETLLGLHELTADLLLVI